MAIEKEKEEDFDRAFEELYVESIYMAKTNKKLREQLKAINRRKKLLKRSSNARSWSSNFPRYGKKSFNNI